jgi:hypothetical protein
MPSLTGLRPLGQPERIEVKWRTCGEPPNIIWCPFETFNLDGIGDTAGVYMIWHKGNPGCVVRIGQGAPIKDRLAAHRNDQKILAYKKFGALHVTWADVPALYRDGVEKYLSEAWPPLVGDAFPDALPIAVNSPW